MSRFLSVLLALLLGLLLLGRVVGSTKAPPPRTVSPDSAPRPVAAAAVPASSPEPLPEASATPTIDLLARLEGRRRLLRVAQDTYFDSLFAETDSVVRRWPEGNREAFVVTILPGDSARYDAELLALVRRAIATWEDAGLGLRFTLVGDTAGARIRVRGTAQLDQERAGQTDLQWTRNGAIQGAQISLARLDKAGKPIPAGLRLAVAVHEFGHALGLGHSPRGDDVMYAATQVSTLSRRDRATIALLYELPLGSMKEVVTP